MAAIQINDLRPVGSELFNDSENFLQELSQEDINEILGGREIIFLWSLVCYKDQGYNTT